MAGPMSCVGVFWNHRLLLIQRSLEGRYPGLWNLPGGKAEPDEHPYRAAARELDEETGIVLDRAVLEPSCVYQTDRGVVTLYALMLKERPAITLERNALGFGWFDLDSVVSLPKLGMAPSLAVHEYRRMILEGPK